MSQSRREFIRNVGIALASLAMARCIPSGGSRVPGKSGRNPRDRLRDCWAGFDWLAEVAQDWNNSEAGEASRDELLANHRAALDEMVSDGELDGAVADEVQTAFEEAVYHTWWMNSGITCYEAMYPNYTPAGASQLIQQAESLIDMADESQIDPDTVARAQATIEHDVAFLAFTYEEEQAFYEELSAEVGDGYAFPAFDELELEITPEAAEAARFLVDLLLHDD
jgi:hypothetical protein